MQARSPAAQADPPPDAEVPPAPPVDDEPPAPPPSATATWDDDLLEHARLSPAMSKKIAAYDFTTRGKVPQHASDVDAPRRVTANSRR